MTRRERSGGTWRGPAAYRLGLAAVLTLTALGAPPGIAAEGEPEPAAKPVELSVSVRKARTLCFQDRVEVTGTLAARQLVDVGADREGFKAAQILVSPLDEVGAGQVLARLVRLDDPGNAAAGTAVKAPVAGIVLRANAVAGMPVSPRQGPLFSIIAGGDLDLQADVPVDDLAKLVVNQSVAVTPLGGPEVKGKVRQIERATSPASQLGRARIGLTGGQNLRVGTFARGIVALGERCGIGVPYSAVSYEAEGTIVHIVNGDRIEARAVEVGLLSGDSIEVKSGVSENDVVVARAGAFVREGDRVNPIAVTDSPRSR